MQYSAGTNGSGSVIAGSDVGNGGRALNVARTAVDQESRKAIRDASKESYIKAFFRNLHAKK